MWMSARARPKWLPPLLVLILTSCATTDTGAISPVAIERVCSAWPYVSWSIQDTPQTIHEAKANNAARSAFCRQPKRAGQLKADGFRAA
jgi:hypothetical protein